MASRRSLQVQPDYGYGRPVPIGTMNASRSTYQEVVPPGYETPFYPASSPPGPIATIPSGTNLIRSDSIYSNGYNTGASSALYGAPGPGYKSYASPNSSWEPQGRISPDMYDDFVASPSPGDFVHDTSSKIVSKPKIEGKGHSQQRRPSNRDEFDGPHQFLQRPPPDYIAQQERDLPHLPTNLVVHEQDSILTQVNDRLSQCAFDFVAKYQFPIPLANGEMRPVERPQDREWTEWVYLLKRLATKRRIPARVLYNGQIKQFITILENSLEMRHAAKHQSRPLKDDRNILQLISAGIQVAKILRDAPAMAALDNLYVSTEQQIQERTSSNRYRV
ncbi:hypothetical protein MBM_07694 [Drepanopeziza brunnea f. sp. 'multigermtubi' MB_m1]|uniref:Uncharacterized protein n=1 Tax=Marssonina brunnea f. sp. multigermtubi (strain MB_m1) TaxID=1072389 RepID=K1WNV4_MARBU|nr:uncharacterized protein MBM_07694 [Drepanopeziza brunnea f. sp. 'multigermtubi' MB_m1]EKD14017.1 hypothetical protein MBM_07694 [Drepanopeziza brunnea f. sp. 'multigermtubi' MB_m1]